jgi:hypothetical protein
MLSVPLSALSPALGQNHESRGGFFLGGFFRKFRLDSVPIEFSGNGVEQEQLVLSDGDAPVSATPESRHQIIQIGTRLHRHFLHVRVIFV